MRIFLACTSSACNKEDKDTFYKINKPLYVLETFFSGEKSCKDALNIVGVDNFLLDSGAFSSILGTTLRISIASFTAYVIGSLTNSGIMVWLKNKFPKSLFVRAISSTIVGQLLDNALFATIAFLGVLPTSAIISMIIGGTIFEVLYEIIFYPITKISIKNCKKYIEE